MPDALLTANWIGDSGGLMAVLRAAFFDMGNTLIQGPQGQDIWDPVVMERIARAFGCRDWAEELYRTDLRRPPPDDPYRQETNRMDGRLAP